MIRLILNKGDVQVSEQERAAQLENTIREVASMVSEKCVNPVNRRPYTMAQIRDGMKSAGFMVHPTRNVKQQFLDCVKLLQKKKVLDIERAKMQLALILLDNDDHDDNSGNDNDDGRREDAIHLLLEEGVVKSDILPPKRDDKNDTRIIFFSDPSLYRKLEGIARTVKGRLEIIQQCVAEEGDVTLGSELERRAQQKQHHHDDAVEEASRNTKNTKEDDNFLEEGGDIVDDSLSNNLQTNLTMEDNATNSHYDLPSQQPAVGNSRKQQKAATKKSKKAKRREREEQAERDERIAAEKTRQKERAERLGIVSHGNDSAAAAAAAAAAESSTINGSSDIKTGGDTKPCNTCGGAFSPGEYRSHFRSDWHNYNVKLKLKGVAPVSEQEFTLCDSDAFFD